MSYQHCAALPLEATARTVPADTKFVADEAGKKAGKPSLAVLSLGCGTTSELSDVNPRAGIWGWAATGKRRTFHLNLQISMLQLSHCCQKHWVRSIHKTLLTVPCVSDVNLLRALPAVVPHHSSPELLLASDHRSHHRNIAGRPGRAQRSNLPGAVAGVAGTVQTPHCPFNMDAGACNIPLSSGAAGMSELRPCHSLQL